MAAAAVAAAAPVPLVSKQTAQRGERRVQPLLLAETRRLACGRGKQERANEDAFCAHVHRLMPLALSFGPMALMLEAFRGVLEMHSVSLSPALFCWRFLDEF